jgi:hypothetical protein
MSDLPTCTASLKGLRMFTLVVMVGDTADLSTRFWKVYNRTFGFCLDINTSRT